jgi:hypothetical protein
MPTFRRIRRSIAAILLVLYLPGCQHYVTPRGMTPQEYIAAKHPKQVRLTVNDITHGLHRFELLAPSVGPGDSLTGLPRPEDPPVTVAISAIERFEFRESNPSGTFGLVLGGAAVVGIVALAVYVAVGVGVAGAMGGGT